MTPSAVMDIVLIAVLAISIILGFARGLIRSLLSVVIFVLALLGAAWIANAYTQDVSDWVQPYVEEFVLQEVETSLGLPAATATAAAPGDNALMDGLGDMMQQMLQSALSAGMTALDSAVAGIVHTVVYALLFILSLIVLQWVLKLITIPFRLVEKIPVVGTLNRIGGGVLGLILGVLICFLIAAIVKTIGFIDPADTTLFRFFAANTPATLLALFR